MLPRFRSLLLVATVGLLGACNLPDDPSKAPSPIGNFQLGHVVIVADSAKQVGPSRDATPQEWETALTREIRLRTGKYDGDKLYHLGIKVEGYALAYPGIPVVLSPKSALVLTVNVWDDTAQRRINAEPRQLTVFEPFSGGTVVGSGLVRSREEQIDTLSGAGARQINDWLVENKAWFTPEAASARAILGKNGGGISGLTAPASAARAAGTAARPAVASAQAATRPQAAAARTPAATVPARPAGVAKVPAQNFRPGAGIDTSLPNSATRVPGLTLP